MDQSERANRSKFIGRPSTHPLSPLPPLQVCSVHSGPPLSLFFPYRRGDERKMTRKVDSVLRHHLYTNKDRDSDMCTLPAVAVLSNPVGFPVVDISGAMPVIHV